MADILISLKDITKYSKYLFHVLLNILVWLHFLFRTFAKRFYISARIQTNLRDNFTNLSVLLRPKRDASNDIDYVIIGRKLTKFLSKNANF
jgi:hypothetical protein